MSEPKVEYRIVCPNFGAIGHRNHLARKRSQTRKEAEERADRQDDHYRHLTRNDDDGLPHNDYYRSEIGWRVQMQTVTEWEDVNDS